ncbi:MAG: CPBP family intramembrane metalloprotease [Ruminococcus sp.]|nr:CPBP family intramembrane metalloprotease [Ruminococcus sp.]
MDKKTINKEIRKISNHSSFPILLYLIAYAVIVFGGKKLLKNVSIDSLLADFGFQELIIYIGIYVISMPLILLVFYHMRGKKTGITIKNCFVKPEKSFGWCAKWFIITMGMTYLAAIFSNMFFTMLETAFGVSFDSAVNYFGDSGFGILVTIIAPVIFAPIMEELIFRGTIYRHNEPLGQWFAIIVSGCLFGLWHANHPQILFAAVMGMFSCFMFAKTRSIIPSMILHFTINSFSTIMVLSLLSIGLSVEDVQNDMEFATKLLNEHIGATMIILFVAGLVLCSIIAGLVLLIIEIIKNNGFANLKTSYFGVSGLKTAGIYFTAPITIIVFAVLIFETILRAMGKI